LSAGISTEEFWRLTPAELDMAFEAHEASMLNHQRLAAWHLAPILNMARGKGQPYLTPAKLMGEEKPVTREYLDKLKKDKREKWLKE
jgi:hypothetical protein